MADVALTPVQRAVVDALRRAPADSRELADVIYAALPDGGPLFGDVAMRVQIHRMRRKGLDIRSVGSPRRYVIAPAD